MNKVEKLIQEEINNLLLEQAYSKILDDLFKAAKGAKKPADLISKLKNVDDTLENLAKIAARGRAAGGTGRKAMSDAVANAIAGVRSQRGAFEQAFNAAKTGDAVAILRAEKEFKKLQKSVKRLEQTNVGRVAARAGGDVAGQAKLTRKGMKSTEAIQNFTSVLKQSGDRNENIMKFANNIMALGPKAPAVQAIPRGNMVLSVAYLRRASKAGVEGAGETAKRLEDFIKNSKGIPADDLSKSIKRADKILDAKKLIPTKQIKKFYKNLDKARRSAASAAKSAGASAEETAKVVKQVEDVAELASKGRWARVKEILSKVNNSRIAKAAFVSAAAYIGIGTLLSDDGESFDPTKPDPPAPVPGPSPTPKPKPRRDRNKLPLKRGSRGSKVKEVQKYLLALGFDLGPMGADGKFGKRTRNAVRDFQKRDGIKVDGIVGKQTFARLKVAGGKGNLTGKKAPTGKDLELPADYGEVKESKKSKLFNKLVENYTR